jgi:hypothetical protein
LYVACAWWEIDQEIVEFAPDYAAQELRDDAVEHGAAPDHGLVARIQQAH